MQKFEINRDGRVVCAATKELISQAQLAAMPRPVREAYGSTCYRSLYSGSILDLS